MKSRTQRKKRKGRKKKREKQERATGNDSAHCCNSGTQLQGSGWLWCAPIRRDQKKKKKKRAAALYTRNKDGDIVHLTATMLPWYLTYVAHPRVSEPLFHNKFRRRFHLSFEAHLHLLSIIKCKTQGEYFSWWKSPRATTQLELLELGALRYLGRGWMFDNLEENTDISKESHPDWRRWQ